MKTLLIAASLALALGACAGPGTLAPADFIFGSNGSVPGSDHYKDLPGAVAFADRGTAADNVHQQMYGGSGHDAGGAGK